MIKTSRQLKDLIRNMAKGDSGKSQLLIRNYAMERFLERVSLSRYKDNFILKGGMLISAMVGLNSRATMDIDTTVKNMPLGVDAAKRIVEEIAAVPLDDFFRFQIKDVADIMEEAEYGGVRLSLDAFIDNTRIPLKIDISTGDKITPAEIQYRYKLMFEDRYITLWANTLETVLAEKLETVLIRTTLNTRLRDFYDLYILQNMKINYDTLCAALTATCRKRESERVLNEYQRILEEIHTSRAMKEFWKSYQKKNSYAAGIEWDAVMKAIRFLCDTCIKQ